MKKYKLIQTATMLGFTTLAFGQPSGSTSDSNATDDVYELSPFVVNSSKDVGYVAVDSLAGGRTAASIKLTPASISSMTYEFIEDLSIDDVRDALRFTPNASPANDYAGSGFGGAAFHEWSYDFRSAGGGQQGGPGPTRNYFAFYQNADTYNVERIEVLRGPNSLVFGLGTTGGSIGTYTKKAQLGKNFLRTTFKLDNHGSKRAEVDFNMPLSEKVGVRINSVIDRGEGWQNADETEFDATTFALTYQPSNKTSIRFEAETAKRENTLFSDSINNKAYGWDGIASETWGAAPTGGSSLTDFIVNQQAWGGWMAFYPVWVTQGVNPEDSLLAWRQGYTTRVDNVWQLFPEGVLPAQITDGTETINTSTIEKRPSNEWTWGNGLRKSEYDNLTLFIDHEFSENLHASLSTYHYEDMVRPENYEGSDMTVDINRQLPNGDPNPNFGKRFADYFLSSQTQTRNVDEVRLQLNYNIEGTMFDRRFSQRFSAAVGERKLEITARQYLAQLTNTTNEEWVQNMIWGRVYLDDNPNLRITLPETGPQYQGTIPTNGRTHASSIAYLPKADGYWFDFDDEFKSTNYSLMSHTLLFDESLSIMAGIRKDEYDEEILSLRRGPNLTDDFTVEGNSGESISAGAVYFLPQFKDKGIGFFANYSENYLPPAPGLQDTLAVDGRERARPGPERGKGLDYGIRWSSLEGKYYAVASRYDTKSSNKIVGSPIGFRSLWRDYFDYQDIQRDGVLDEIAYSDFTSREITGYEFEITGNPTKHIRFHASYALPEVRVVDYYPDSKLYYEENLSTWRSAIPNMTDPLEREAFERNLEDQKDNIDQVSEGLKERGVLDYTASVFANYIFSGERDKGWTLGLGMSARGPEYIEIRNGEELYAESRQTYNAAVSYTRHFGETKMRVALNIDNLLDDDDPIVTNYDNRWRDSASGAYIPNGFYLRDGRSFKLTTSFDF